MELNTAYKVAVSAQNSVGEGQRSMEESTNTLAITQPDPPQSVQIESGDTTLKVTWTAPGNIGGELLAYRVYWRVSGAAENSATPSDNIAATATSYVIEGLELETSYEIQVAAVNSAADTRSSDVTATTNAPPNAPPSAPTGVNGVATSNSIEVNWNAPSVDNGQPVTGYRVYIKEENSAAAATPSMIITSPTTSYEILNLVRGTRYEIRVAAINSVGTGDLSEVVIVQTLSTSPPGVPGTPTLTAVTHNSIMVMWEAATDMNDGAATVYRVYWRPDEGAEMDSTVLGSVTTYKITGLSSDSSYIITVRAENSVGNSLRSAELRVRTRALSEPINVVIEPQDKSLLVSWGAPMTTSNLSVDGYRVYWRAVDDGARESSSGATLLPGNSTSYKITALTNGNTYWVQVAASNNSRGEGSRSPIESGVPPVPGRIFEPTTCYGHCGVPRTVPEKVPMVTATLLMERMIKVVWGVPNNGGAAITTFNIYWGENIEGDRPADSVSYDERSGATTASYTIMMGLSDNTTYQIAVSAVNVAGEGAQSTISIVYTPVQKPAAPIITEVIPNTRALKVVWNVPTDDGGEAITAFTVYWNESSGSEDRRSTTVNYDAPSGAVTASFTITNLAGGTTYMVTVSASNPTAGEGEESTLAAMARTAVVPPTAPRNVKIRVQAGALLVEWAVPVDTSNLAVDTYTVYWDASGNAEPPTPSSGQVASASTSVTLENLENGKGYWVEVSATSSAGEGDRSVAILDTPRTVPNQVILTNAEVVGRTINVEWEVPGDGGAAITEFRIDVSNASSATENQMEIIPVAYETVVSEDESTASFVIDAINRVSLFGNTTYRVSVSAVNIAGEGPSSTDRLAYIPASPPGAPGGVQVAAGNASLRVSWAESTDTSGLAISAYTVYWAATRVDLADSTGSFSLPPTSTTHTIENLKNGEGYWVEVSATSSEGEGLRSVAMLGTPRTIPSVVSRVSAIALDRAIMVEWDVPDDGGAAITTFNIYWRASSASTETRMAVNSRLATYRSKSTASYTITELFGNTTYQIAVSAENVAGMGERSDSLMMSTVRTPISGARAPRVYVSDSSVDHALTVQWDVPTDNGGAAITSFAVSWRTESGANEGTANVLHDGVMTTMRHTISELLGNTTYQITVAAFNQAGLRGEEGDTLGRTRISLPTTPVNVVVTSQNKALLVSWDGPNDTSNLTVSYRVYWQDATSGVMSTESSSGIVLRQASSYTITGLTNNTGYWVQVSATSSAGEGVRSARILSTPTIQAPQAPQNLSIEQVDNTLVVTWSAPSDDGGSPVLGYSIEWLIESTLTSMTTRVGSEEGVSSPYPITSGLTEDGQYLIRVRARNEVGLGVAAEERALFTRRETALRMRIRVLLEGALQ